MKEITAQFTPRLWVVKNKEGNIITEEQDIKHRWREYTEELYKKNEVIADAFQVVPVLVELQPTEGEVTTAVKNIANNK